MLKIMYREDSNAKPAAYRRNVALYQAASIMDKNYYEHKRTGRARHLMVDLLPVETLCQLLLGHTDVISNIESEYFPGYVIVGITSRYANTGTDFMYIELYK